MSHTHKPGESPSDVVIHLVMRYWYFEAIQDPVVSVALQVTLKRLDTSHQTPKLQRQHMGLLPEWRGLCLSIFQLDFAELNMLFHLFSALLLPASLFVYDPLTQPRVARWKQQRIDFNRQRRVDVSVARPYPQLPLRVRPAKESDIQAMIRVSIAGFKSSEIFQYIRCHHNEYQQDTEASLEHFYREKLRNICSICLVSVDNKDMCVGLVVWDLPKSSCRIGQFKVHIAGDSNEGPRRDEDHARGDRFTKATSDAEKKYLAGMLKWNKLVIHPDSQSEGRGQELIRIGCLIADTDNVDQGVIPSHRGAWFYKEAGFAHVGEIDVEGDSEGFRQEVLVRKARPRDGLRLRSY